MSSLLALQEGGLERALELVKVGGGIEKARHLARMEAEKVGNQHVGEGRLPPLSTCTLCRSLPLTCCFIHFSIHVLSNAVAASIVCSCSSHGAF